jgi:uncharacterized protein (TIGR03435 family)
MLTSIYDVKDYQVSGGPKWADEELYAIAAQTDGFTPTMQQAREMLQALFADRFHLEIRREARPMDVFALVVDSGGLKMKPAGPDAKFDFSYSSGEVSKIDATVTPTSLVYQLNQFVKDRPIVDETGLSGFFDVKLEWTPAETAPDQARGPSLVTAVREQLGLRLDARKAPMQVLVIEKVERPSQN